MGRHKISYDTNELKESLKKGATYAEIAEAHNVSIATVKNWIADNDLPTPQRKSRGVVISDRDLKMKAMREEGYSLQQIGDAMGITRESVRLALKKQGVVGAIGETNLKKSKREEKEEIMEDFKTLHMESIMELVKQGVGLTKIAEEKGVSTSFLVKLGVSQLSKDIREERDMEVKRLYEEEQLSMAQVASKMGLHTLTVLRKLREMGVQSRPQRRWNKD